MKRRTFIKQGLAAGAIAFPTIIPGRVLARNGNEGANDRITLGIIGTGIMGSVHVQNFSNHCNIAAISDAYLPHAERSAKWLRENDRIPAGAKVDVHQDYRHILERDDIDAVVIASPQHWHALHVVHAAQAGKHIYCEKPLTYSIWEGRQLVKAVEKYNVVLQTGSQQRSGQISHDGITHVRNGTLGKITEVHGHNYAGPQNIDWPAMDIPEGLDWDLWCGPAEKPPYNHAIRSNARNVAPCWSGVKPFSGGDVTDWGTHGIDMIQWALGADHGGPEEIWVEGDPYQEWISTPENPGGRRGGPKSPIVHMRYPGDIHLILDGGPNGGGNFIGENGTIHITRGRFRSDPRELAGEPIENPVDEIHRGREYARRNSHSQDWLNCIRDGGKPVAHAEAGHRTASVCHLMNIARWVSGITGETGRKLKWDAAAERFTNSDEANQFVRPPMRQGYQIPEEV